MEFDVTYRIKIHNKEVALLAQTRTKSQFSLDMMSMIQEEINAGRIISRKVKKVVKKDGKST